MTILTRRQMVQQSSAVLAANTLARPRRSPLSSSHNSVVSSNAASDARSAAVDPELVRSLAMRALDAAKAAGATYADVRVTRIIREYVTTAWSQEAWNDESDSEHLGFGVRALVNGYWGFAGTPYWTASEAARVATTAVAQAKFNAKGPSRAVEFVPIPSVTGSWHTPVTVDPFRISLEEKVEFLRATIVTARHMLPERAGPNTSVGPGLDESYYAAAFTRQEHALATTDGSYVTQTLYRSMADMPIMCNMEGRMISVPAQGVSEAGRGWEMIPGAKVLDQLPGMLDTLLSYVALPSKPVDVGRNTIVCDAVTMAGLLDATFGRATEVDRALGYEANASGTSYLGPDPLTVLGTTVASSAVTLTANRSLPTGLATVQWDAEGIRPEDFTVVRDGTLVDYQTTREQAAWLAPWYTRAGTPVRSHGCAAAENATFLTMQMTPNLALAPAKNGGSFEDLVSGLADGLVIEGGATTTDFQCKNGVIQNGKIFQVKQGKRVAMLKNAAILFNTTDLWKKLTALGGAASVEHVSGSETKGEPSQRTFHTVSAVPAAFKDIAVVDMLKKA